MTDRSAPEKAALAKTLASVAERLKTELAILDEAGLHAGAAWLSKAIDVIETDLHALGQAQH